MTYEPHHAARESADQARSDGIAAIAITLVAAALIIFLITRII